MPHNLLTFAKAQTSRGMESKWVCLVNRAEQTKQAHTSWLFPSSGFLMKVFSAWEWKQSFIHSFNIHQAPISIKGFILTRGKEINKAQFFPSRSSGLMGKTNTETDKRSTRWWVLCYTKPTTLPGMWRSLPEECTLGLGFIGEGIYQREDNNYNNNSSKLFRNFHD
jgi:hypothetical protein